MHSKKKTQLLTAIIAVLISVSLVTLAVYATTTVGNDVSVGGTLTVTGTSTLASTLYVNQATGRVGIGTASPAEKLTVSGNISTDNLYAQQTIWTDKLLESSNLQFNRAHHEIGGRSKGDSWTEAGTDALPVGTSYHTSLVYDGKMWVIGGEDDNGDIIPNVYYSSDGVTWTEAGTDALPVATDSHTSLVYDGKMWVIGGVDADWNILPQVYYSTDGANWIEAGTDALPVATGRHTSLVYDGKMWVIGGYDADWNASPKVYYSSDGATWTEAGTDALLVATYSPTSLVYDGKMWVIGGSIASGKTRKVYYSSDGVTWTEAGTDALPVATHGLTSLVYDGKMWVIGGSIASGKTRKVYYSSDGVTWTEAGTDALPVATTFHTSLVYDGKMWVIGGENGVITPKVYYSLPAIKGGLVVQDQSNNELFRITPDGYVGIGTTTPTSTLQVQGSLGLDYVSKSADYTATADDNIIAVDASSATTTITLPSSSGITGRVYTIKKTDSSSNDVVVDGNASETIDGSTTYSLTSQWEYLTIISDGTNWLIIANN